MPQYDLIVPSGEAVLVDRATGVRLRLSANPDRSDWAR